MLFFILLSFAQFERELIGECTRDKMSAARRKGKWVGGCPVLGYDIDPGGGRLVVNEEEAERVRAIFALFEVNGSVQGTLAEVERRGWHLKSWTTQTGRFRPGGPFTPNSLRRLLTNILYTVATLPHQALLRYSISQERHRESEVDRDNFGCGPRIRAITDGRSVKAEIRSDFCQTEQVTGSQQIAYAMAA